MSRTAVDARAVLQRDAVPHLSRIEVQAMQSVFAEADVPALLSKAAEEERRIANERRARDGRRPIAGGRPAKLAITTTLIVLLALQVRGHSPNLKMVAAVLEDGLARGARRALGLPEHEPATGEDRYAQVLSAWERLSRLVDPVPLLSGRNRITATETRARLAAVPDDDKRRRLARCFRLQNQILDASLRVVNPSILQQWDGSVAIDGTGVPIWGKRGSPRGTFNTDQPLPGDKSLSPEAWAGWYVREGEHRDDGTHSRDRIFFGIDVHQATAYHAPDTTSMPLLVVAIAINTPGHAVGEMGADLLASLHERGYKPGYVAADMAYGPNAKPDNYARRVWALGYQPVMDYPKHKLGQRGNYGGAPFIEGALYSPGMPARLHDITARHRAGELDDHEYRHLVKQREAFLVTRKAAPNAAGTARFSCPAAGKYPTATCTISTHIAQRPHADARKRPTSLPLTATGRVEPGLPICMQSSISVSFDNDDFVRHYQPLQFESEKWHRVYHGGRNRVEAMNKELKSVHKGNIVEPSLRRMRGYGKQAIFIALQTAATNILNYRAWLATNRERTDQLDEVHGLSAEPLPTGRAAIIRPRIPIDELAWHPPEVPQVA